MRCRFAPIQRQHLLLLLLLLLLLIAFAAAAVAAVGSGGPQWCCKALTGASKPAGLLLAAAKRMRYLTRSAASCRPASSCYQAGSHLQPALCAMKRHNRAQKHELEA